ncbi:MAG TPA: FAD-binding oxidoreductase [Solirubrobacteraceae bacterium]|jgi:4-cresol dehydrogenase (hydroxylating)
MVSDDRLISRLEALLGDDAVRHTPEQLAEFLDPYPLGDAAEFAPGAVVSPSSVAEVQAVVRLANELGISLWATSRGKNNAYGGASPRVAGSVVVELTRMNRVIEVNEESAYAVLEPGVRFYDLYAHLRENGHRLWASVPELGWGSVIGNGLDRGLGYTPYGEHGTKHCGYEVVLPDGELLRTGMGAMTNSQSFHLYQPGFGPAVDGLFQQSNFGIVVKAGVWLMPTPETFAAVDVSVPQFTDLAALIDALRPLRLDGTIRSPAMIGEALGAAAHVGPRLPWYDGPGAAPESVVGSVMEAFGIGRWTLFFGLYGSAARVAVDLDAVRRAFGSIPGVEIRSASYQGDASEEEIDPPHRSRAGIPGMYAEHLTQWRERTPGTGSHTGFSPVLPLRGRDALAAAQAIRARVEEYGFDYMGAFHAGQRYCNHIVELIWDGSDSAQVRAVRELFARLITEAAAQGHGEYRTHLAFMDLVARQFDWGGHALLRLQNTLKDAVDPNGILAPGKSGVWPARLR